MTNIIVTTAPVSIGETFIKPIIFETIIPTPAIANEIDTFFVANNNTRNNIITIAQKIPCVPNNNALRPNVPDWTGMLNESVFRLNSQVYCVTLVAFTLQVNLPDCPANEP